MLFPEVSEFVRPSFPELYKGWSAQGPIEQDPKSVMLYGLRHTSTDIDDQNKSHGGMLDTPINESGIVEAIEMAKKIKDAIPTRIVSSDAKRALMTAGLISRATGVQIEPTEGLRPLNTGIYSGLDGKFVHKEMKPYFDNPDQRIPGGESVNEFQNRNLDVLRNVLGQSKPGEKIVLMGHSITPRLLDALAYNKSLSSLGDDIKKVNKPGEGPLINIYKYHPENGKLESR